MTSNAHPVRGVRGRVLPGGEERTVCFDGDRITFDVVAGVELVHDGGWIVPGLVDVHTHPGAMSPGDPLDEDLLQTQLAAHAAAGVACVRTPGIVGGTVPPWVHDHPELPRVVEGGNWLAATSGFFAGWGYQLPVSELAAAAVVEAERSGGWSKLVVDWASGEGTGRTYGPTVPPDVVASVVAAVHAVGGRVAVHAQHPEGAEAAVAAGADSIEHGMLLPTRLLDRMRDQGIVLVPTMSAMPPAAAITAMEPQTGLSRFLLEGVRRHPGVVRAAHEAGVTILAGTDSPHHHGHVAGEAAMIAAAGVDHTAAAGGASWVARTFLGLPGVEEGAPADLVMYDADPRQDIAVLGHPVRVVHKGNVLR